MDFSCNIFYVIVAIAKSHGFQKSLLFSTAATNYSEIDVRTFTPNHLATFSAFQCVQILKIERTNQTNKQSSPKKRQKPSTPNTIQKKAK